LQILTDWGAVGLLLFANFLRVAIRPLTGLNLSTSNAALAISIIAYSLITGMIDGGLYHPQFLICVGIAFAILLAQLAKTDVKPSTLVISPVPMILVILVMLVTHLRMF
jgi:hypothetical protein